MAIFPGGPGLASTRMSPFWILMELRMMEMVMTIGVIRHGKLQSNHHHQHPAFDRLDAPLSPNQQCQSTEVNLKCL